MLSSNVSEILTTQLTTAPATASILEVLQTMVAEDVGRIIITDAEVPIGIFTEKDVLRRVIGGARDIRATSIRQVMTSPVRAVREETHIVDAFAKMYRGKFRHLLVRGRRGKIVGIVSMRRILKIAVELGQGKDESRTLGDIAAAEVVTVGPSASVAETVELMNRRNAAAVVVAEKADAPLGIFTERDALRRVAARGVEIKAAPISQVMTAPVITMPRSALVGDVLAEMYRRDIRNMPVCDAGGALCGLVSMPEVLRYAQAFDIDEEVRRTWKEVAALLDTDDQYTPG